MRSYLILFAIITVYSNSIAKSNIQNCGQIDTCQNEYDFQHVYDENIIIFDTHADNDNNIYNIGSFKGTVDFNPDPYTNSDITSASPSYDSFVQKFDEDDNLLWTKTWRSDGFLDISTDSNGNIFIAGSFKGEVDFDPSSGVNIIASSAPAINPLYIDVGYLPTRDGFLLKLNTDGNFLWVIKFGSAYATYYEGVEPRGDDSISDIDIDSNNNIIISGFYSGSTNFDGNQLDPFHYSYGLPYSASFVAKIDNANGQAVWAYRINTGAVDGLKIDLEDNIVVAHTTSVFDNFAGTQFFLRNDFEISKFDPNGQPIWNYQTDKFRSSTIAIDNCNNIFSTGLFIDGVSNSGYNFLLKLSSIGSLEFSTDYMALNSYVDIDKDGNVYVAKNIDNINYQICKYQNTGNLIWKLNDNWTTDLNLYSSFNLRNMLLNNKNEIILSGQNSNRFYNSCKSNSNNGCPNGILDECGVCDGAGATIWYADTDNDGLGNPNNTTESCEQPTGYVSNANDMDDTTPINPADIPTLSQWGLILLCLILLNITTVSIIQNKTVLANSRNVVNSAATIPFFNKRLFKRMLQKSVPLMLLIFVSISLIEGGWFIRNFVGAVLSVGMLIYLFHFIILSERFKNEE